MGVQQEAAPAAEALAEPPAERGAQAQGRCQGWGGAVALKGVHVAALVLVVGWSVRGCRRETDQAGQRQSSTAVIDVAIRQRQMGAASALDMAPVFHGRSGTAQGGPTALRESSQRPGNASPPRRLRPTGIPPGVRSLQSPSRPTGRQLQTRGVQMTNDSSVGLRPRRPARTVAAGAPGTRPQTPDAEPLNGRRFGPLGRLGAWTATHFRPVLLAWLVIIVGLGAFAPRSSTRSPGPAGRPRARTPSMPARSSRSSSPGCRAPRCRSS